MKSASDVVMFRSKRNKVFLCQGKVEKHLSSDQAASFEAAMLEKLFAAGVRVPGPIHREGRKITMPFVPGETLPELLERWESSLENPPGGVAPGPEPALGSPLEKEISEAAGSIISWLKDFYQAAGEGIIRGDVNGRNFILNGEVCWGLDFEESAAGEREEDLGRLIAFVLSYDPPGTLVKRAFADSLLLEALAQLNISREKIMRYRDEEFAAMAVRRN